MGNLLVSLWESIKIAVRMLRVNKLRSVLTTLGIMIGVLTVIGVSSIIVGLNKAFQEQISSIGSNTLYIQKFPWVSGREWFKYRNRRDITFKDVEYVLKHSRLADLISPSTSTGRNVSWRKNSLKSVEITGTMTDGLLINNLIPSNGRLFTSYEVQNRKPVAVIGSEIAEKLFQDEVNPVGQYIKIGTHPFLVVGVLEKRGSIFGYSLDSEIFIPIGALFKVFGSHRSLTIQASVYDPEKLEQTKEELTFIMRNAHRLKPDEEDDFSINQQDALTNTYKQLTTGLYSAAVGIGLLSLIVGGIGIMNIMLVSVSERTREIGIRKALGARNSVITVQFIIEAVIICLIGGAIGIILGFGLSSIIRSTTPFPSSVPFYSVIIGLGFSSLVGLFFGIYPARKAAKLNPIEALRYE